MTAAPVAEPPAARAEASRAARAEASRAARAEASQAAAVEASRAAQAEASRAAQAAASRAARAAQAEASRAAQAEASRAAQAEASQVAPAEASRAAQVEASRAGQAAVAVAAQAAAPRIPVTRTSARTPARKTGGRRFRANPVSGQAEVSLATADCRLQVLSRSGTDAHLKTLRMDGVLENSTFMFTTQPLSLISVAARPGLVVTSAQTATGLTVKLIEDGGTPVNANFTLSTISGPQSIVFTPGFITVHARGGLLGYVNAIVNEVTHNGTSTTSTCSSVVVNRAAVTAVDAQVLVGTRAGASCTVLAPDSSSANTGFIVLAKPGSTSVLHGLIVGTDPALLAMSGSDALVLFRFGANLEIRRYTPNFSVNPPTLSAPTTLNTLTTPGGSTLATDLLSAPDGGGYYLVGTLNGALTVDGTTTLTADGGQPFVIRFGTDAGVAWAQTYPSPAQIVTRRAVMLDDQIVIAGLCVGFGGPMCPVPDSPFAMSIAP